MSSLFILQRGRRIFIGHSAHHLEGSLYRNWVADHKHGPVQRKELVMDLLASSSLPAAIAEHMVAILPGTRLEVTEMSPFATQCHQRKRG